MLITTPFKHPWVNSDSSQVDPAKCIDEYVISNISSLIRKKPEWQRKYKDTEIVAKWKKELQEQDVKALQLDACFDYMIKELAWYEQLAVPGFDVAHVDHRVVLGQHPVPEEVEKELQKLSVELEESFGDNKDYHPGSNNQVVDLVHPSLWPLQYGVTPGYAQPDTLVVAEFDHHCVVVKKEVCDYGVLEKFQWLPLVFELEDGQYRIKSYINNLHPKRWEPLYRVLEKVFNAAVPGLTHVLEYYAGGSYQRIIVPSDIYLESWYDKEEAIRNEIDDNWDLYEEKVEEARPNYVRPHDFNSEAAPLRHKLDEIKQHKVIVKLANIELTPENPKYNGGSWHVEGTINEDIIATILYYYDTENITQSLLSFRTAMAEPMYEQGDTWGCTHYFGAEDEEPLVYPLGAVDTNQGNVLIFPNTFQHHVDGFELKDPTKPGHRKIVAFFVVDPNNEHVATTELVPPQNPAWWDDDDLVSADMKTQINILNPDLPQSWDKAVEIRKQLMEERSQDEEEDTYDHENPYIRTFSLCEH